MRAYPQSFKASGAGEVQAVQAAPAAPCRLFSLFCLCFALRNHSLTPPFG